MEVDTGATVSCEYLKSLFPRATLQKTAVKLCILTYTWPKRCRYCQLMSGMVVIVEVHIVCGKGRWPMLARQGLA